MRPSLQKITRVAHDVSSSLGLIRPCHCLSAGSVSFTVHAHVPCPSSDPSCMPYKQVFVAAINWRCMPTSLYICWKFYDGYVS
jgi:hypothetical protein